MISNKKKVVLFIPCYNEEKRLKIDKIKKFISEHSKVMDFVFIDDGSNDNTIKIIKSNFSELRNVELLYLPENIGKGNAIRHGVLHISLNYKYFAFIDADMDIPFEQITRIISMLEKNSVHLLGISVRNFTNKISIRNFISISFICISNLIIRPKKIIRDTQCGCKVFDSKLQFIFEKPFISNWLFDIEIFLRLKQSNFKFSNSISQVNLEVLNKSSNSNLKLHHFPRVLLSLFKIIVKY